MGDASSKPAAPPTTTAPTPSTTTATTISPTPTTEMTTEDTAATTTSSTPTIISATPATDITSITPISTESTSKPTLYSVAMSLTSNANKEKSTASSAYTRWYKWSKFEQQKRDKGRTLWYMNPPVTTTDTRSATTMTLTTTTAKIDSDQKEPSNVSNIVAIPSYHLRSTAVYSPPHGDRILSGRNELTNTDASNFKYYLPENRFKTTVGNHTKATMYQMNTHLKQTPLPTQSYSKTAEIYNSRTNTPRNTSPLPQPISRDPQTDLPPIGKVLVSSNNQSRSSSRKSYPRPSSALQRPSILKKSSTGLSREKSKHLSKQAFEQIAEDLRQSNEITIDGIFRGRKVRLSLQPNPPIVSFNLPSSSSPPSKARESISRSERLLFS